MSERVGIIKAFAELAFSRYERATEDLKETVIGWRPLEEANNIRWILTHLSRQWNVSIPRVLEGNQEYTPEGWPENYGEIDHPLEKLLSDLEKGKSTVLSGIDKLSPADLDEEVPSRRGPTKRQSRLLISISEILHHEGQIAYLRGAIGRRRQKDLNFLA